MNLQLFQLQDRWRVVLVISLLMLALVVGAVTLLRPDPVTVLARQLAEGDGRQRYKAAKHLEDLGPNARPALAQLAFALMDDDPRVRYRSAKTLSKMGDLAGPAVPALIEGLKDAERDVRYYCAKSLYKVGKSAEPARDAVLVAIEEDDPGIRRYLVKVLGDIGEEHAESIKMVRRLCNDSNSEVRMAAKDALEDILD